jgi:site-specific recombinase
MTAASLAGTILGGNGAHQLDDLVTMIARISRSQLAAAVGNIACVIPAALLLDFVYVQQTGRHFLDEAAAAAAIGSFHPLHSGTIPYAALTGVLLWMSSLAAGWLENWSAYRRLPEAIEHHRAGRWLGRRTMARAARLLQHHLSGLGGSAALGLLLGMTPVMGVFFGLPLDVRHVTLSTGSLTLAAVAHDPAAIGADALAAAAVGIAAIGLLNFGVSFALALAVAFRARQVTNLERLQLVAALARRFARAPGQFFFPPRDAG